MEPWKDMTETATGTLLIVAGDINGGLIGSVRSAERMLTSFAEATRKLRAATTPAEVRDVADHVELDALTPSAVLDGATTEYLRLIELHMRALPLSQAHTWTDRRWDAMNRARDAGKRLSIAVSTARAFEKALRRVRKMTVDPVPFSPTWSALTSVTLRLANDAVITNALALHALHQMRNAVLLEIKDVSRIDNR